MRSLCIQLLLVAAAGCTPAQEEFETEALVDFCGQASQCARSYPDEECVQSLRTDLFDRQCRFNDASARACADQIAAGLPCEADQFGTRRLVVESECRATYDCKVGANWLDPILGPDR